MALIHGKGRGRKLIAAAIVAVLATGVGLWRAHAAAPATAEVTSQQARAMVIAKLIEMEPAVDWASPALAPDWKVVLVPDLTRFTDHTTGVVVYSRPWPVTAWVVEIQTGRSYGFGVVSAGGDVLAHCTRRTRCERPGILLAAQASFTPPWAP